MQNDRPAVDFLVNRKNLAECRFVPAAAPADVPLAAGEALVAVDRFALTANNVTYAVAGDMIGYWQFFPVEPVEPVADGWGRIPVWGFGDVLGSADDRVREGERLFGYFPMSSWLVIRPGTVTPASIVDASAHRKDLPPVYNQYTRVGADPLYAKETEDRQMLFRPLFLTAFLLDDFLADEKLRGASAVLLTSASSKTALGLASLLSANRRAPGGVVGLTSARNARFVEGLGCYDRVITYDAVASIPAATAVAIVDMAGDAALLTAIHRHFGDGVKLSSLVGLTHHDRMGTPRDLPGATPTFFFAPDRMRKRAEDWGPGVLQQRMTAAWRSFLSVSAGWIRIVSGRGEADVERVYRATLEGRASPEEGHVLSLR
jgi:hypothetical protein